MNPSEATIEPWYKHFFVWVIIAPLILVVCVCAVLLTVSFKGGDDVVIGNYYKEGRMINDRVEQDQKALELGLKGELVVDNEVGELHFYLSQEGRVEGLPDTLQLALDHPIEQDLDRTFELYRLVDGHYRADLEKSISYRWYARIFPKSSEGESPAWRLIGELQLESSDRLLLGH